MASFINNNNDKDDESKGEDITNNHAEVVVLDPIIVQEMSEMNIVNDDPSFIDILPSGGAGQDIVYTILSMLDMKSVRSLIYSSFIQLFCKNRNDDTLYQLCKDIQHQFKIQLANELKIKYKKEFPKGTPLVVACEKGRFEDVKLLITGRNDGNGSNGNNNNNMTLKEYVIQEGKSSYGYGWTPLGAAADQAIIDYLFSILLDGITRNTNTLTDLYKNAFPNGTPIVCACEKGRFEDVKLLITGYNDVNGSNGNNNNNMTLKEYVNQEGKSSGGGDGWAPLTIAAQYEHFQIVKYLIEQGEADPNIADRYGVNALHLAAGNNKKDTKLIELLLTNMSLTNINKNGAGDTPLDWAYDYNKSPIKQKIIDLIRSKGGKSEYHEGEGWCILS